MWKKGQSGNPAGRPKGAVGLAGYVRKHTGDGQKLVDLLLRIVECPDDKLDAHKVTIDHRLEAVRILLNRGFGRSVDTLVLGGGAVTLESVIMQHFGLAPGGDAVAAKPASLKEAGAPQAGAAAQEQVDGTTQPAEKPRDSREENAKRGEGAAP